MALEVYWFEFELVIGDARSGQSFVVFLAVLFDGQLLGFLGHFDFFTEFLVIVLHLQILLQAGCIRVWEVDESVPASDAFEESSIEGGVRTNHLGVHSILPVDR